NFLRGKCNNAKLASVCVRWNVPRSQPSPMPKLLDKPAETNVPIPRADFVTCPSSEDCEAPLCELFSFPIVNQQKRLDVFKWATNCHYSEHPVTHALVFELKNA
ncbi:hypothetical protein AAVH_25791, partial [Aphelenchoides avenae]